MVVGRLLNLLANLGSCYSLITLAQRPQHVHLKFDLNPGLSATEIIDDRYQSCDTSQRTPWTGPDDLPVSGRPQQRSAYEELERSGLSSQPPPKLPSKSRCPSDTSKQKQGKLMDAHHQRQLPMFLSKLQPDISKCVLDRTS